MCKFAVDLRSSWSTTYLMSAKDFTALAEIMERSPRVESKGFTQPDGSYKEYHVFEEPAQIECRTATKPVLTRAEFDVLKAKTDAEIAADAEAEAAPR